MANFNNPSTHKEFCMQISQENLDTLFTSYSDAFNKGIGLVPPVFERLAMTIPSMSGENIYGWLKDVPGMREWMGDRVMNSPIVDGYRIQNKKFESTIAVKGDDIEDDQYGIYEPLFTMLGENAARHPNDLAFEVLSEGFTTPCFDGKKFFDTEHPVLDKHGKEQSVSNFMGGTDTAWYLACTTRTIKPLIFQTRKRAELVRITSPKSHKVFMTGDFLYGVDARYNVGFGLWKTIIASKQPLTKESYEAARMALTTMPKDYGKLLALTADLLIVPPSLESAARRLMCSTLVGVDGVTEGNIWKGASEVLVSPWLK